MEARYETIMEEYCKTLNIEALTMSEMTRQDILPLCQRLCGVPGQVRGGQRTVCAGLPCRRRDRSH